MENKSITLHCISMKGIENVKVPTQQELPFEFIVNIVISILVLTPNVVLIIGQQAIRPLNITDKLFIYLSVIDSLSVLTAPFNFYLTQDTSIPCWLITLEIVFEIMIRGLGFAIIALLSSLRFLSIWKPFYQRNTGKLVKYFLIVVHLSTIGSMGLLSYIMIRGFTVLELGTVQIVTSILVLTATVTVLTVNLFSKHLLEKKFKIGGDGKVNNNFGEICSIEQKKGMVKKCIPSFFKKGDMKRKKIDDLTSSTDNSYPQNIEQNKTIDKTKLKEKQDQSKKRRAVYTLSIITSFYFVLFLPFALYILVGGIYIVTDVRNHLADYFYMLRYGNIANIIGFTNSGVNAVIYIWRNKKIKDFYKMKYRTFKETFSVNINSFLP